MAGRAFLLLRELLTPAARRRASQKQDKDNASFTVSYKGQEKKTSVPEGVPIVTFGPLTEADLKPGKIVFVPAQRCEDGSLATDFVVVSTNGVATDVKLRNPTGPPGKAVCMIAHL